MTQQSEGGIPDPFGAFRSMRDSMMESWSKSMIDMVNTDQYAQAMGAWLDGYLSASAPFRKAMEQSMTQVLETLNMPSRAEIVSIAERMTNIEMRLDDMDAKLDGMQTTATQSVRPEVSSEPVRGQSTASTSTTQSDTVPQSDRPAGGRSRARKEQ